MAQNNKISPTLKLNSGYEIPLVGLGTFDSNNQEKMTDLLREAFIAGYRHIDTAIFYENHKLIGQALKIIFSEGAFKREDIFITTKVYPLNKINCIQKLQEALLDLQLVYVDLYLVHWPCVDFTDDVIIQGKPQHIIWHELEQCVDLKLTRSIGVSNYNVQSLVNILSFCKIKPALNQVELTVYLQQPNLVSAMKKFGIAAQAYSPLARGGLNVTKVFGKKLDLFNESLLVSIANKYKKTVAQVVLNFMTSQNIIVIPKTEKVERLKENIDLFEFQLNQEEILQIQQLNNGSRTVETQTREGWGGIDVFA